MNGPTQITADYTIGPNSWLGYLNVTVTTPGGTSEPVRFAIYPGAVQFGLPANGGSPKLPTRGADVAPYESFDVGLHAAYIPNPDGSRTDAYLDVSFTDDKGHPVTVGGSYHGDMDNVVAPDDDDDEPGPGVTPYSFAVQSPEAGRYVLHIKSSRSGSFELEIDTTTSSLTTSGHESLALLSDIPSYPGNLFELHFVCHRDPFRMDIDSGGLQPPNGAFSFAQPLTSEVRLPAEVKALGVVIYYDPLMEPSSLRAVLDGNELTNRFHVRPGELELVSIELGSGQHTLIIRANNKSGLSTEQQFHIQH